MTHSSFARCALTLPVARIGKRSGSRDRFGTDVLALAAYAVLGAVVARTASRRPAVELAA
jgi:hypothetical protein